MTAKKGFTLIELLVVIAIIALLAAILFPVFAQARAKARQTACLSNLRQIGTAMQEYCDDWDGRIPWQSFLSRQHGFSAAEYNRWGELLIGPATTPWDDSLYQWWDVALMPYIKNGDIWFCPSVGKEEPVIRPASSPPTAITFGLNKGTYACNYQTPPTSWFPKPHIVLCGSLVESFARPAEVSMVWDLRHWRAPNTHNIAPPHHNLVNVLYADGHVKVAGSKGNVPWTSNYYTEQSWSGLYDQ